MSTAFEELFATCPKCGLQTLSAETTVTGNGWTPATRYACVSADCTYEHTIEHPQAPIYALGHIEDKRR